MRNRLLRKGTTCLNTDVLFLISKAYVNVEWSLSVEWYNVFGQEWAAKKKLATHNPSGHSYAGAGPGGLMCLQSVLA